MSHVSPRPPGEVPGLQPVFQAAEAAMGFVPNSMRTMAHMPQLPLAFASLANVIFGGDLKALMAGLVDGSVERIPEPEDAAQNLPPGLVQLIAFATSLAAGCRYCQAHTSHSAHRVGEDAAKFDAILTYDESPLFSEAERAALALAFAAGLVPNESDPGHFERLREHFTDRQIVQIAGVIALFGFLNRWNDTLATELEATPRDFAATALSSVDWQVGKHAS
ncbi:MAG: carboxymuconolactone decarboxylase family protein [Gammaproteobacteria bacterium]|nr:carboxymuconolactone decarboxylase family protein [Gammaproteobacteria bacterium]